ERTGVYDPGSPLSRVCAAISEARRATVEEYAVMKTNRGKARNQKADTPLGRAAVRIFAANERMNQMILEHLDAASWNAKPPGKARSIAAIFTHVHNVRTKWLRLTAPHLKVPRQLQRADCTLKQARTGLEESAVRCQEMLAEAL